MFQVSKRRTAKSRKEHRYPSRGPNEGSASTLLSGRSLVSASRNMLRCIRYRQISWSSFQSNRCRCLKPDNSVYFAPRSTAWAVEPRNRPPSRSSNTSQSQSKPMRLFSLSGIQGSVRAWVRAWGCGHGGHGWGAWGSVNISWCAREAGVNAGDSPAGAIRRFSTEDRANCVVVRRGGEQAWSRTGRSQFI